MTIEAFVLRRVWDTLEALSLVEHVPWVTDPSSPKYDPLKVGYDKGSSETIETLRNLIVQSSEEWRNNDQRDH